MHLQYTGHAYMHEVSKCAHLSIKEHVQHRRVIELDWYPIAQAVQGLQYSELNAFNLSNYTFL